MLWIINGMSMCVLTKWAQPIIDRTSKQVDLLFSTQLYRYLSFLLSSLEFVRCLFLYLLLCEPFISHSLCLVGMLSPVSLTMLESAQNSLIQQKIRGGLLHGA